MSVGENKYVALTTFTKMDEERIAQYGLLT